MAICRGKSSDLANILVAMKVIREIVEFKTFAKFNGRVWKSTNAITLKNFREINFFSINVLI